MAEIIKAPSQLPPRSIRYSIFLAGTIDMGTAENWQAEAEKALADLDIIIFNPRRDNWDPLWEQSKNNPLFKEQVLWELAALDQAHFVFFVFASNNKAAKLAKAPITFLELGRFSGKNCAVCCPNGFYRKGNVELFCDLYGIPLYEDMFTMFTDFKSVFIKEWNGSRRPSMTLTNFKAKLQEKIAQ